MSKVFFIGIGGAGMSKLALMFHSFGDEVYGSDVALSSVTEKLKSKGIIVYRGHDSSHITKEFDLVVYSSAIKSDNVELERALSLGIKTLKRGEALAEIVNGYKNIVVSGTHGKTTTTSLIGHIFKSVFGSVNVYVGGMDSEFETFYKSSPYFVIESDESDGSFLYLSPDTLVITNIDKDHLKNYGNSMDNLKKAFLRVAKKANTVIYCADDANATEVGVRLSPSLTYGIKNKSAYIQAFNIQYLNNGLKFRVRFDEGPVNNEGVFVPLYGDKNVLNTLAAILVAKVYGISVDQVANALRTFRPPRRRMEVYKLKNGTVLIDDHADHPTEVSATLKAVRAHFPGKRIIAVFQPHRYSRVAALRELIATPFVDADKIIVMDIYPAFEKEIPGINGNLVFNWIKSYNQNKSVYFEKKENDVINTLLSIVRSGDVVVLLGPGSIGELAEKLVLVYGRVE